MPYSYLLKINSKINSTTINDNSKSPYLQSRPPPAAASLFNIFGIGKQVKNYADSLFDKTDVEVYIKSFNTNPSKRFTRAE